MKSFNVTLSHRYHSHGCGNDTSGSILYYLTYWGRVTHICVSKLTNIGSDNGLSPGRRQVIMWINAGILSIRPLGTNFSEISFEINTFSFKKLHLKMSSENGGHFDSVSMCKILVFLPKMYVLHLRESSCIVNHTQPFTVVLPETLSPSADAIIAHRYRLACKQLPATVDSTVWELILEWHCHNGTAYTWQIQWLASQVIVKSCFSYIL